jgi:hypothetical protein
MTDITAKPFDWNDNLSKEAIEDFEGIQKDLPYCTCQSIGMALAKLELLEKQGCKVIEQSGNSSEKPNKTDDKNTDEVLDEIIEEIKKWYWDADKQKIADDPCVVDAMIDLFIRTIKKHKAEGSEKK